MRLLRALTILGLFGLFTFFGVLFLEQPVLAKRLFLFLLFHPALSPVGFLTLVYLLVRWLKWLFGPTAGNPPAPTPAPESPKPVITRPPPQHRESDMTHPEDTPKHQHPIPPAPPPPPAQRKMPTAQKPGSFDREGSETMRKVKNWILFGSETLPKGASLEFAIASQWLLRIGLIILVMGIGFFVKYSIDQNWISQQARILAAAAGGMAMLVGGSRILGGKYAILGQGLMGAGITTLYFSTYAAQTFYGLIDETTSFFLMAAITALSGCIAVRFNAASMAVLAVLGGYAAPLMFPAYQDLGPVLTYILVIAAGVLGISTLRDWPLVKALAFACHFLLFHVCVHRNWTPENGTTAILFLALYFLLFSTMPFLRNLRKGEKSGLLELGTLHLNAAYCSLMGWHMMTSLSWSDSAIASCSMGLAFFYAGHALAYLRLSVSDKPMLVSFMALSAIFLAMTMPLYLSGLGLTTAWAFQAVAMAWMARKLGSGFLRQLSYLLILVVMGRYACIDLPRRGFLAISWEQGPVWSILAEFASRLATYGLPLAGMITAGLMLGRNEREQSSLIPADHDIPDPADRGLIRRLTVILGSLLTLVYLGLEISQTTGFYCPEIQMTSLTLLGVLFAAMVIRWGSFWIGAETAMVVALVLAGGLGIKLLGLDYAPQFGNSNDAILYHTWTPLGAASRLVDFGAFAIFLMALGGFLDKRGKKDAPALVATTSLALTLLLLTTETANLLHALAMDAFRQGAISILWTLYGLGMLVWGIRRHNRWARYAGLALFTLVTGKVFLVDLSGAETLYRVGAFMALGVLLLTGSFLYLRHQKTINSEILEESLEVGGQD